MRIIGSGVDIVSLTRLYRLGRAGKLAFWLRAFTEREVLDTGSIEERKTVRYLAGNFAIKEAVYKACGGTDCGEIDWKEIEIRRSMAGQPTVTTSGDFNQACEYLGIKTWSASIAYTSAYVVATAIALSD